MVSKYRLAESLALLAAPLFVGSLFGVNHISIVSQGEVIYLGKVDNVYVEYREEVWSSFVPVGESGKKNTMRLTLGGTTYLLTDARDERNLDSLAGMGSGDTIEEVVVNPGGRQKNYTAGDELENGTGLYNDLRDKIRDALKKEREIIEKGHLK